MVTYWCDTATRPPSIAARWPGVDEGSGWLT